MDNTSPPCNRVREITGKSVREAAEQGLNKEQAVALIRENVRQGLMSHKQEVRGTDAPVEDNDVNVEGLSINKEDDEFTALIEVDGRRGAILVADNMDNTSPPCNRVREVTYISVRDATKRGADKEETVRSIEANIRQELGKTSLVEGLNVNEEDNEFTALIQVEGRRGAIPVSGELF